MEKLVERENQEMKLFSGDCARLKKELNESRTQYNREYQTRMQLESLVERLKCEAGDELKLSRECWNVGVTDLTQFLQIIE